MGQMYERRDVTLPFDNSYARLPATFYTKMPATPVANPQLIKLNTPLAQDLGLNTDWLISPEGIAALAGNLVPDGADPLAQVYAGHQFGGWSPQLGDGRAILLGEVIDAQSQRRDIQLKGSGPTPYSRRGDGRAWLGPVLREYIVSESMHAFGVPTTRALAAVSTGERVQRERAFPGAVLTRVAASHIRVGTFQYFAARRDVDALKTLTAHTIARHYPDADGVLGFLRAVIGTQADLIARWMGVGFIHGVMNTDNMAVSGETIDYGPCAFMDRYHPQTVFSSIDQFGRYAFNQQPDIGAWNLAQLASSLIPLIDTDQDKAVALATEEINAYPALFRAAWLRVFAPKIGLQTPVDGDAELIQGLLDLMAKVGADFTNTFRALADGTARDQFSQPEAYDQWHGSWLSRLAEETTSAAARADLMRNANPAFIPRNHRVEEAIQAALNDDFAPFERLNQVLKAPYENQSDAADLAVPPSPDQEVRKTFCGT